MTYQFTEEQVLYIQSLAPFDVAKQYAAVVGKMVNAKKPYPTPQEWRQVWLDGQRNTITKNTPERKEVEPADFQVIIDNYPQ